MSGYHDGRRVEYAVQKKLRGDGYDTIRGSSSKGLADIVAIKPGQVLLVNVKKTDPPGPDERANLLRLAGCLPGVGVPLVALGPASRVTFRRLTGHGHADWLPWTPDEITPTTAEEAS